MDIGFGTVTKLGILTKFGIGTVTKLGMDSSTESEWGRELVNQPDHRNRSITGSDSKRGVLPSESWASEWGIAVKRA